MNDFSLSQKCPLFQGRPQETRLCLACSKMLLGMKNEELWITRDMTIGSSTEGRKKNNFETDKPCK